MTRARQALAMALMGTLAWPALAQHWGYAGEAGPEHWAKLDPGFALCASGRNQSPIDLAGFVDAKLAPLVIAYRAGAAEIVNNGHTVQVDYAPGSALSIDGRRFELKQFHFHAPSENRIAGKQYALEAHLVHGDANGDLAVVAVMFEAGKANPLLETLWQRMPEKAGGKATLPSGLSVARLLPANRDYYRFNGSLTTPPCSEGVRWLVMKRRMTASKTQIERFARAVGGANNRPLQPVNARAVLK